MFDLVAGARLKDISAKRLQRALDMEHRAPVQEVTVTQNVHNVDAATAFCGVLVVPKDKKNGAHQAVPRFGCVGLGGLAIKGDDLKNGPVICEWLTPAGFTDAAQYPRKHGIIQTAIRKKDKDAVWVLVKGVTMAQVDVIETWHLRAAHHGGDAGEFLRTHPAGFAEIIAKEKPDEKGKMWAAVDLQGEPAARVLGVTADSVKPGGQVQVWAFDNGENTRQKFSAYLDWMACGTDIKKGTECVIEWDRVRRRWFFAAAECDDCGPHEIEDAADDVDAVPAGPVDAAEAAWG